MRMSCCPSNLIENQVFSYESGGLFYYWDFLGPPGVWCSFLRVKLIGTFDFFWPFFPFNENWVLPYRIK